MPTPEQAAVAELLIRKARSDLTVARALGADTMFEDDVVGFHAQQAVEKALKAVLALSGIAVPRTHDIATLADLISDPCGR